MLRYAQPWQGNFYMPVKQSQLREQFLLFKRYADIWKSPGYHAWSPLFHRFCGKPQKFFITGTVQFIAVSVGADVSLFHTVKILIQLLVKILPITIPQGYAHMETEDTLHLCFHTVLQDFLYIFPGIIDKRQNRTQPHHRRNSRIPELFSAVTRSEVADTFGSRIRQSLSSWHRYRSCIAFFRTATPFPAVPGHLDTSLLISWTMGMLIPAAAAMYARKSWAWPAKNRVWIPLPS